MTGGPIQEDRLQAIRQHNPFAAASVGDPMIAFGNNEFPDVPSVNKTAFDEICRLVSHKQVQPDDHFAALVLGEVGEGKTHLMARLRRLSRKAEPPFAFAYIQPIEDPERPFGYLLREWISNLRHPGPNGPWDTWLDWLLGAIFLDVIESQGRKPPGPKVREMLAIIRNDPASLFGFPVSEPAFQEMEKRAWGLMLSQIPGMLPDVWIALKGLRHAAKRPIAMAWLQGVLLSPQESRRLGISLETAISPAAREDEARGRLMALSALMARYRQISVICFDRLENLETNAQVRAFGKMVEFLVDAMPATLPVACFRGFQWEEILRNQLNQHVVSRLEANCFYLEGCGPDQAVDIIRSRLAAALGTHGLTEEASAGNDLYPFDPDALRDAFSSSLESPREVVIRANRMLQKILGTSEKSAKPANPDDILTAAFLEQRRILAADFDSPSPDRLRRALHIFLTFHPRLEISVQDGNKYINFICQISYGDQTIPVAFIIDSETHHLSVGAALDQGIAFMEASPESRAVYIREAARSIPKTWRGTLDKMQSFEKLGGCVAFLDQDSVIDWLALAHLHYRIMEDGVSTTDPQGSDTPVSPEAWQRFVGKAIEDGRIAGFKTLYQKIDTMASGSLDAGNKTRITIAGNGVPDATTKPFMKGTRTMARRALLVGINDYQSISDLRGCRNDVRNVWDMLRNVMGFRNQDIRVVLDNRATKRAILDRLNWMVDLAGEGDVLLFHFSGHGSQIRDRDGDDLRDQMDELICPWDMSWEGTYILDDDLEEIFKRVPNGASLEVFMDSCHSGWDTGPIGSASPYSVSFSRGPAAAAPEGVESRSIPRYVAPPEDIQFRWLGEEDRLRDTRRFTSEKRSTAKHIIWAGCRPDQTSADAFINGDYHGAFTYYYCQHVRETQGNISRRDLLERVRASLRYNNYTQVPQLECGEPDALVKRPIQFRALEENQRLLFLTSPNMRGRDVADIQQALKDRGHDIEPDGIFGPYTRVVVMNFQERNQMLVDGVVGPAVRAALLG